ncbi:F420-dependent methylenetetrahydromethanopterin dehydrogenase [Candidatus Methanocrinis natronophilus]
MCGSVRLVQEELDGAMASIIAGSAKLPAILSNPEKCTERMDFKNPYARAKAIGALQMAQTVAGIDAAACLRLKELDRIALTAAGHEVMRAAAILADEAGGDGEVDGLGLQEAPRPIRGDPREEGAVRAA